MNIAKVNIFHMEHGFVLPSYFSVKMFYQVLQCVHTSSVVELYSSPVIPLLKHVVSNSME